MDNQIEIYNQVQEIKKNLKNDFNSMKRGVEMLSDAEVEVSTLDAIIFLLLRKGVLNNEKTEYI